MRIRVPRVPAIASSDINCFIMTFPLNETRLLFWIARSKRFKPSAQNMGAAPTGRYGPAAADSRRQAEAGMRRASCPDAIERSEARGEAGGNRTTPAQHGSAELLCQVIEKLLRKLLGVFELLD